MLVLGFLQSTTRLILVSQTRNQDFGTTDLCLICLLVMQTSLGLLYWLFSLESYTSSLEIEQKLNGLNQPSTIL